MDDVDKDMQYLKQNLKLWADGNSVILETKGGAIMDNYDTFIVTSQYSIDDIWEDEPTREALHRRFRVIHMTDPFKVNEEILMGQLTCPEGLELKLGVLDKVDKVMLNL